MSKIQFKVSLFWYPCDLGNLVKINETGVESGSSMEIIITQSLRDQDLHCLREKAIVNFSLWTFSQSQPDIHLYKDKHKFSFH